MPNNFQMQLNDFQPTYTDKVYISPFTSKTFLAFLLEKNVHPTFYDTTLQGSIDLRSLQKENLQEINQIIYSPFFGQNDALPKLEELCYKNDIALYQIPSDLVQDEAINIHKVYCTHFSQNRDFTFFETYSPSSVFPIFLQPQFFCPKEDIVQALSEADIDITLIKLIYKDNEFSHLFSKVSLFGASECQKSFIGLPYHISEDEAKRIAKALLAIMDNHSLRRCSF